MRSCEIIHANYSIITCTVTHVHVYALVNVIIFFYLNVPMHFNVKGILHTKGPLSASGNTVSEVTDEYESEDHLLGSTIVLIIEEIYTTY